MKEESCISNVIIERDSNQLDLLSSLFFLIALLVDHFLGLRPFYSKLYSFMIWLVDGTSMILRKFFLFSSFSGGIDSVEKYILSKGIKENYHLYLETYHLCAPIQCCDIGDQMSYQPSFETDSGSFIQWFGTDDHLIPIVLTISKINKILMVVPWKKLRKDAKIKVKNIAEGWREKGSSLI